MTVTTLTHSTELFQAGIRIVSSYLDPNTLSSLARCNRYCHSIISNSFIINLLRERAAAPNVTFYPEYSTWKRLLKKITDTVEKNFPDVVLDATVRNFPAIENVHFDLAKIADKELVEMLAQCHRAIQSLSLANCGMLSSGFLDKVLSATGIDEENRFLNLRHFNFKGLSISFSSLIDFIKSCPQLTSMVVPNVRSAPDGPFLPLKDFLPELLHFLPKNLENLDLNSYGLLHFLQELPMLFPKLRSLRFTLNESLRPDDSFPSTLTHLACVFDQVPFQAELLSKVDRFCPNLKSLKLYAPPYAQTTLDAIADAVAIFFDHPHPLIEHLSIPVHDADTWRKINDQVPNLKSFTCYDAQNFTAEKITQVYTQIRMNALFELRFVNSSCSFFGASRFFPFFVAYPNLRFFSFSYLEVDSSVLVKRTYSILFASLLRTLKLRTSTASLRIHFSSLAYPFWPNFVCSGKSLQIDFRSCGKEQVLAIFRCSLFRDSLAWAKHLNFILCSDFEELRNRIRGLLSKDVLRKVQFTFGDLESKQPDLVEKHDAEIITIGMSDDEFDLTDVEKDLFPPPQKKKTDYTQRAPS